MTTPEDILSFWFAGEPAAATMDANETRWFGVDPAFDADIRDRFGDTIRAAAAGDLHAWCGSASGRLALIILLDQFSRNAFRSSPQAYASDSQAVRLCIEGVVRGQDRMLTPIERLFFYLPLLHSEQLPDQEQGIACLRRLRVDVTGAELGFVRPWLRLARHHCRIIARFGRFPHRNAVLGRPTTREERAFLFYHKLRRTLRQMVPLFRRRPAR